MLGVEIDGTLTASKYEILASDSIHQHKSPSFIAFIPFVKILMFFKIKFHILFALKY